MDEHKDKDVSVSLGNLLESTVTVSGHVAGGSETQVESGHVGQIEESFEESASGGGENIMVEVVGSHVFVDGACGNDSSVRVGGEDNLNGEETHVSGGSGEAGSERDLRSSGGGDDLVGDLGKTEVGISGHQASLNDGSGTQSGEPLVEIVESNREVINGEGGLVGEMPSQEVSVLNDKVYNVGTKTGVEGSTTVVGSTGGEAQVVHVEDSLVVAKEEDLNRGLVEENVKRDSKMFGTAGSKSEGHGAENRVVSPSVVSDTLNRETRVVVEEFVMGSKDSLGKELVKGSEEGGETNVGGDDAHQDAETQKVGNLEDEIWNPSNKTAIVDSSAIMEDSNVQTQVVEEAVVVINDEEGSNSKYDIRGSEAMEGIACSSKEKQTQMAESDGGTRKDGVVNVSPKSLDKRIPDAVGEISAMDKEEFMCSTIEGMETDTFDESLSFSLEELQGNIETVDGGIENSFNVCADSKSSCRPIEVVGGEDAAMAKMVHPDSEKTRQLKLEACLDQVPSPDVAPLDSNIQAIGIHGQVTDAELDGKLLCSGDLQNNKDERPCMGSELNSQVSGRADEIPLVDNQEVLNSNVEAKWPAEKDQQLKLEESLDKNGASHLSHVDSNIGKGMAAEQQVNDAQVSSDGRQEMEVQTLGGSTENNKSVGADIMAMDIKVPSSSNVGVVHGTPSFSGDDHSLNPEVVCGSTEMDSQVINGGEIVVEDSVKVLDSNVEGLALAEVDKSVAGDISEIDSTVGQDMKVEEQVIDPEEVGLQGGQDMEVEEWDNDTEQPKTTEEKLVKWTTVKASSSLKSHQASYQLPLEKDGDFDLSDLVWGKVRSHPWWPGQIYDPSDASEKAMKYHKKDCFLVAYFGDRTFAWVEASQLKPFYSYFSQVEKQSNSEVFQNAVNRALEEVSRCVELELACQCIPKDAYDGIRLQIVENTGIRPESSLRDRLDKSVSAQSFQPDKLVEYMKELAQSPSGGADRLELVMAKAQLLSFYRLKGYSQLPEFQFCGGLAENGVDSLHVEDKMQATPVSKDDEHISSGQEVSEAHRSSYHKRKHNLKDSLYPRKKERSLSELMSGSFDSLDDDELGSDGKATSKLVSPSSGKKRKVVDSTGDDSVQDGRKTISLAKVSITTPNVLKPSFKIGECIRRVASQMTGSPSILKSSSERLQKPDGDGADISFENLEDTEGKKMVLPEEYESLDDLLSQLRLAARDPMKGYSFLDIITSFFSDFRNSIIVGRHSVDKVGGKRKRSSHSIAGSPETFEFEDMSDTYWTDRVIQNGGEEEPSSRSGRGYQIVPVDLGKPVQKSRRSYSRKQYSDVNHDLTPVKPPGYVDENSPAELVMNFSEVDCVPSETNLNKMFRRFGPLKESETEVDEETSRARVVFKKTSDAKVAYSSAAKFNIFGPIIVNYQLSYSISVPFKASPIVTTLGEEYAT